MSFLTESELGALSKADVVEAAEDLAEELGVEIKVSGTKDEVAAAYLEAVVGIQAMGADVPAGDQPAEVFDVPEGETMIRVTATFQDRLPSGESIALVTGDVASVPDAVAENAINAGVAVAV